MGHEPSSLHSVIVKEFRRTERRRKGMLLERIRGSSLGLKGTQEDTLEHRGERDPETPRRASAARNFQRPIHHIPLDSRDSEPCPGWQSGTEGIKWCLLDFPGGPVVQMSPFNTGGVGLTLGPAAKTPHTS